MVFKTGDRVSVVGYDPMLEHQVRNGDTGTVVTPIGECGSVFNIVRMDIIREAAAEVHDNNGGLLFFNSELEHA